MSLDAMKQVLAVMDTVEPSVEASAPRYYAARKALRAAIEEAQEPVAWLSRDEARLALWEAINKREFGNPTDDKLILEHLRQHGLWIGKYTAPQPRQWQGLTDDEIKAPIQRAMQHFGFDSTKYSLSGLATIGFYNLVKEIEAKLKEKNT